MSYGTVVWLPNALILTALLALVAVWRWRSAGALSGLRWTGVALLPLALYGIGLFRLIWTVGLAFSRFVTGFVWRPSVWLGLMLLVLAVLLIAVPRAIQRRGEPVAAAAGSRSLPAGRSRAAARGKPGPDRESAEIEDILKRHGIS